MAATSEIFDLVGLGFGPANIAISGAITEAWKENPDFPIKSTLFIEKHEVFRWHPGMLLPGARMQISFMKDLATLRNPGSPYTFLSYLHSEGRLLSFINRGGTVPTRKEYSDYLTWASKKVQENGINVKFGHEIVDLEEGTEDTILVRYKNNRTGEETVVRARDLVISPGGLPKVPDFLAPFQNHPRVRHSSGYATSIGAIFESLSSVTRPLRVAVIGSGQSAAEVTMDVRNRLGSIPIDGEGRHTVEMLIRKGSLKPSDDSPFANEIFDPAATERCFNAPSKRLRDAVLEEYRATNYGVVNPLTLDALYEIVYDQRLNAQVARRTQTAEPSEPIIDIRTYTAVDSVKIMGDDKIAPPVDLLLTPIPNTNTSGKETFQLTLRNLATAAVTVESYDIVLYATGYQRQAWVNLLKHTGISKHFGLSPVTRKVNLRPTTDLATTEDYAVPASPIESDSPVTTSAQTSPPTSPETSMWGSAQFEAELCPDLFLTRQYRLLPKASQDGKALVPRIYLQGVEEATHGLSDTLLSVLGVRAGEVIADLSNRK
ncbi:lysine/ornithine N-monooxygenase [Coprinellus micaceus]|uniref:L-ornithine N(5)-monooxygenase [NAD(P)H] n=1 Tax=Coprinellus micaceus TaxID=71717 RepID=A0A4Y7TR56_COPMI|nr:lysine/ornithine N-monooxygenase [Coprinellus micaceus]